VYKQNVKLQNSDKSFRCWLSVEQAERMLEQGTVVRVSKRKDPRPVYQMKWLPNPSDSVETSPLLTPADTKAMVGFHKVNEVWVERLIGFNLLPEGTLVPESGYL
jgi:hypothetical protein